MKKITYLSALLIAIISIYSCEKSPKDDRESGDRNYSIKMIDSCEYIEFDNGVADQRVYSLTHKGNCKFCKERNKSCQ